MYQIVMREVYDVDDVRMFMGEGGEKVVNIGRLRIDGMIDGRRDNVFEVFDVWYCFEGLWIMCDVLMWIIWF